jgi:hypothetical protein
MKIEQQNLLNLLQEARRDDRGDGFDGVHCMYVWKHHNKAPCKQIYAAKKWRKKHTYWVNLIEVHYPHVINITMKSLCPKEAGEGVACLSSQQCRRCK